MKKNDRRTLGIWGEGSRERSLAREAENRNLISLSRRGGTRYPKIELEKRRNGSDWREPSRRKGTIDVCRISSQPRYEPGPDPEGCLRELQVSDVKSSETRSTSLHNKHVRARVEG